MDALIDAIWQNETILFSLGVLSIVTFIVSLILIPFFVVRIPVDYFSSQKRHVSPWAHKHVIIRWVILILKNILGMVFIILGIAMLVLPGQGILTILIGLLCLNFPGKYRLERWLIQQKAIHQGIDWLRRRAGKPSLVVD